MSRDSVAFVGDTLVTLAWYMLFLLWSHFLTYSAGSRWGGILVIIFVLNNIPDRSNVDPPWFSRSSVSRVGLSPYFSDIGFNSLAFESQVLRDKGLSYLIIPMLLKARKLTSRKAYYHTWISKDHTLNLLGIPLYLSLLARLPFLSPSLLWGVLLSWQPKSAEKKTLLGYTKTRLFWNSRPLFFPRWFLPFTLTTTLFCLLFVLLKNPMEICFHCLDVDLSYSSISTLQLCLPYLKVILLLIPLLLSGFDRLSIKLITSRARLSLS